MFPQCCGDLSDIIWWKSICFSSSSPYYNGHPCPEVNFDGDNINFECLDVDDPFDNFTKQRFVVNKYELRQAYQELVTSMNSWNTLLAEAILAMNYTVTAKWLTSQLTYRNVELGDEHP